MSRPDWPDSDPADMAPENARNVPQSAFRIVAEPEFHSSYPGCPLVYHWVDCETGEAHYQKNGLPWQFRSAALRDAMQYDWPEE